MTIEITMQAVFWLSLRRDDLEPLFVLAEHHYDSACRAAAQPRGFLYVWRVMVSAGLPPGADTPKCRADWRDLDLTLKICENLRMAVNARLLKPKQAAQVERLCATILTAMRESHVLISGIPTAEILGPDLRAEQEWARHPGRM